MATAKVRKSLRISEWIAAWTKLVQDAEAVNTTQDGLDMLAAELHVSATLRRAADARYEKAKAAIIDNFTDKIDKIKSRAVATEIKASGTIEGVDYTLLIHAAKPVKRLDADKLLTELAKLGIKQSILDKAKEGAYKSNAPAVTLEPVYKDHS